MSEVAEAIIARVREDYSGDILEATTMGRHELVFTVAPDDIGVFTKFIVEYGWWHLSTITGVDEGEEISILYHLCGEGPPAATIKTAVPKAAAKIQSITSVIPGATMYEREVHDLLGVEFDGHPRLDRLVLPDDWPEGVYPLRIEEIEKQAERDKEEKEKKEENG